MADIQDLYHIISLHTFRRTPGVIFDNVPVVPRLSAIDEVIHEQDTISPGPIGDLQRPWYMHPFQKDNLLVLQGERTIDLYSSKYGQIVTFHVTREKVILDGQVISSEPCIFGWPTHIFHRVQSGPQGSASINFAQREAGFDIRTNFNIYDLDIKTGEFQVIREGHLDQESLS